MKYQEHPPHAFASELCEVFLLLEKECTSVAPYEEVGLNSVMETI